MVKRFFIFYPDTIGNLEEEYFQCLRHINDICLSGFTPLKLNFFTDVPDFESLLTVRSDIVRNVEKSFTSASPVINVTSHPPEKPWKVVVEGTFIKSGTVKITRKKTGTIPYIILESDPYKEIWAAGISTFKDAEDTSKAAIDAFSMMVTILENENMSLNNIVRQWNYIGNILDVRNGFQNYQIFNDIRGKYYKKYRNDSGFPAATGVGMRHGGVILDFCAVSSAGNPVINPVTNPNQLNAYQYSQEMLKGTAQEGLTMKNPPQFERALIISNKSEIELLISGTASIIGQETYGRGNIAEQTEVTIENLDRLIDRDRIAGIMGVEGLENGRFLMLRVYIKKQEDFGTVKRICDDHFPGVPKAFIEADICRDDLLIEIEADFLF
jgi:enamine deaminase RidA (YjgF/YER057c/UK114 family)